MKITTSSKLLAVIIGTMLGFCSIARSQPPIECPPLPTCGPCGETIINGPLPSTDSCAVQPFQNFIATSENCFRSMVSGFYLGTGFGYGRINFQLNIPGVLFTGSNNFSRDYIVEYATAGYLYSRQRVFIAGELGYYYNTNTRPFFYEDGSSIIFTPVTSLTTGVIPITTVFPCTVRLDLNSNNHGALDFLPGFFLGECFALFGRIGVEYASFTWVRRVCIPDVVSLLNGGGLTVDINVPFINRFGDVENRQTSSAIGLRLGVGAAYYATRHVGFTLNYVHVTSGRVTFSPNVSVINDTAPFAINGATGGIPGTITFNTSTLTVSNTIRPSHNEVLLGVIFSF